MNYLYYPGCSLEASAVEYDRSTRALMEKPGITLSEIPGWNCCGATAAEAVSDLLSLSLCARNLALAEAMDTGCDILVPCSACYLNLRKTIHERTLDPELCLMMDDVLSQENLTLNSPPRVRHLLDILSQDITPEFIQSKVVHPLRHLTVAPYYGCQAIRPFGDYDNPENPMTMHHLIEACGADVHPWTLSAQCCGASNMTIKPESAQGLVRSILEDARGADAIVTVCPMCQLNLEGFQKKLSREYASDLNISVLYLPQLLGLAMGLSPAQVMLEKNLAVMESAGRKLKLAINPRQ